MMGRIRRKLRSQRGASLLLALLFLLICCMVSASILMAAVANAGKHRSSLEEHQVYLALSSAVSLLCDELSRSAYEGQYSFWEHAYQNPETGETTVTQHLQQREGIYRHIGTETAGYLNDLLRKDFDAIFAREIQSKLAGTGIINEGTLDSGISPHSLTLTPQTGTALDERPVRVELVVVEESYAIELTAHLEGLEEYRIKAEITPAGSELPTIPIPPTAGEHVTAAVTWRLGWITILDDEEAEP